MCEVKLHLKLPIFVMRQLVRHRTSSLNEYSARYSVLTDEMYVPEVANILPQSKMNKQGRDGALSDLDALTAQQVIRGATLHSYSAYKSLLNEAAEDSYREFSDEFPEEGVARELARIVMPVAGYTELYWKQNLHNLFHMLKLREDSHAQWEIQEFARAIYALIKPLFPAACEAYEDYIRDSKSLSGMEVELMQALIHRSNEFDLSFKEAYDHITSQFETESEFLDHFRMSKRELIEFKNTFKL
jgi:thymidylate synthase (FAD)